jgi:hypothetical protein
MSIIGLNQILSHSIPLTFFIFHKARAAKAANDAPKKKVPLGPTRDHSPPAIRLENIAATPITA